MSGRVMLKILDVFAITGRGTVVALDGKTDLSVAQFKARFQNTGGDWVEVVAHREWLLRRQPATREDEAFLLVGVEKSDVLVGSLVEISAAV